MDLRLLLKAAERIPDDRSFRTRIRATTSNKRGHSSRNSRSSGVYASNEENAIGEVPGVVLGMEDSDSVPGVGALG